MLVVLVLLIFLVAVLFSMLGQGGGVLYTPLQVWAGVEFHTAAATSLFLIMVVSLSASLVFHKVRKIDWPLILVLESATMSGGFLGGLASARVPAELLSLLFALVVMLAGGLMLRRPFLSSATKPHARLLSWRRQVGDQIYQVNLGIGLPLSLLAGLVSGMVGVGGGILKVPLMVMLLGVPVDIAIGSSSLMIGLTAGAGFAGHLVVGHWDWRLSILLAVAVFAGGQIGSRVSVRISKQKLKQTFGWFMLVIALLMIVRAIMQMSV